MIHGNVDYFSSHRDLREQLPKSHTAFKCWEGFCMVNACFISITILKRVGEVVVIQSTTTEPEISFWYSGFEVVGIGL